MSVRRPGHPAGADLERATLLTEHTDAGTATLDAGKFRAPVAPGSASELVIRLGHWSTGDLDGKGGVDAVAITVEEPGSGGTFYYLHSLVERDGALHGTDRMVAAGHEAENHTFDHIWLDKAPRELFVSQVTAADDALHAAAGERVDPIACLRLPYAAMNAHTRELAAELGKSIVLWSVDTQDWRRPGAEQIAAHVLANVRPGAIILMHDGGGERSQTVAALDTVLDGLAGRGYAFGLLCS